MYFLSLYLGKAVMGAMRLLGRGGGAFPGLIVERFHRQFLPASLAKLPRGSIVVTGTNGKTTTTKALVELLQAHGLRVLTNRTGSNFVRGAISSVLEQTTWTGRLPYDVAVFELDEAYAVHFVRLVRPRGVLVLNVMRDQMDRFGEIDTTAKLIGKAVAEATDWVVLNANDPRVAGLRDLVKPIARTLWFGHSEALAQKFVTDDQHYHQEDASFFEAARPDVELTAARPGEIEVTVDGHAHALAIKLEGTHNAINLAAVLTVMKAVDPEADFDVSKQAVAGIRPAFGRGERIPLPGGGVVQLQLVKNPGGFTHALGILDGEPYAAVGFAINDDYADGRDVSWLWDVDFHNVAAPTVVTGGVRGTDMAVRLKYDDVPATTEGTLDEFVRTLTRVRAGERSVIFCTYTAMLALRKVLRSHGLQIVEVGL